MKYENFKILIIVFILFFSSIKNKNHENSFDFINYKKLRRHGNFLKKHRNFRKKIRESSITPLLQNHDEKKNFGVQSIETIKKDKNLKIDNSNLNSNSYSNSNENNNYQDEDMEDFWNNFDPDDFFSDLDDF